MGMGRALGNYCIHRGGRGGRSTISGRFWMRVGKFMGGSFAFLDQSCVLKCVERGDLSTLKWICLCIYEEVFEGKPKIDEEGSFTDLKIPGYRLPSKEQRLQFLLDENDTENSVKRKINVRQEMDYSRICGM